MVSYCNMSYHQPPMTAPNSSGHGHHSWYPTPSAYRPQGPQMPSSGYCMQEEQQMWPVAVHPATHHFHADISEYVYNGMHSQSMHQGMMEAAVQHQQMPSPTVTVSDMSSPGTSGGSGGNLSPQNVPSTSRPTAVRSPYDWLKNKSYQHQPTPDLAEMALELGKTRTRDKYRVVYSEHQRLELEREFNFRNKYLSVQRKVTLAAELGLSERQIKIWFQNRRAKDRKQTIKKKEETKIAGSIIFNKNNDDDDNDKNNNYDNANNNRVDFPLISPGQHAQFERNLRELLADMPSLQINQQQALQQQQQQLHHMHHLQLSQLHVLSQQRQVHHMSQLHRWTQQPHHCQIVEAPSSPLQLGQFSPEQKYTPPQCQYSNGETSANNLNIIPKEYPAFSDQQIFNVKEDPSEFSEAVQ